MKMKMMLFLVCTVYAGVTLSQVQTESDKNVSYELVAFMKSGDSIPLVDSSFMSQMNAMILDVEGRKIDKILVKYHDSTPFCKDEKCFDSFKVELIKQKKMLANGLWEQETLATCYFSGEKGTTHGKISTDGGMRRLKSGRYVLTIEDGNKKKTVINFSLK